MSFNLVIHEIIKAGQDSISPSGSREGKIAEVEEIREEVNETKEAGEKGGK